MSDEDLVRAVRCGLTAVGPLIFYSFACTIFNLHVLFLICSNIFNLHVGPFCAVEEYIVTLTYL